MTRRIFCLLLGHDWHSSVDSLYFHAENGEWLYICYRCGVVRFR